jgi:hypothetical protein
MLTIDFSQFRPPEARSPIWASNVSGQSLAATFSYCDHPFGLSFKGSRSSRRYLRMDHPMMHPEQKMRIPIPMQPCQMGRYGENSEKEEAVGADAVAGLLEEGDVEDMVGVGLVSATTPLLREPTPNKSVKQSTVSVKR